MDPATSAVIVEIISWVFISLGSIFAVIGGIGMLRMPDFYTRLHAAGITDTMGAGMILLGLMVQSGLSLITVKLFLIGVFIFFTSPTSTHAVAKAAIGSNLKPFGDKSGGRASKR